MELHIVDFIKTLSPRDRMFYLLMRSYERDLNEVNKSFLSNENTKETLRHIADMYESQLSPLIKLPIYDNQFNRNENAGLSSTVPSMNFDDHTQTSLVSTESKVKAVEVPDRLINLTTVNNNLRELDEFAEKLGPWASSFSSDTDDSSTNLIISINEKSSKHELRSNIHQNNQSMRQPDLSDISSNDN